MQNQEKEDEIVTDKNDIDNDLTYYRGFVRFNKSDSFQLWNSKLFRDTYPETKSIYDVMCSKIYNFFFQIFDFFFVCLECS